MTALDLDVDEDRDPRSNFDAIQDSSGAANEVAFFN